MEVSRLTYLVEALSKNENSAHQGLERGRVTGSAFIERVWRTVKWEHIYLNPADDGPHLH